MVGALRPDQARGGPYNPKVEDPDRLEAVTAIGVDKKRFLNATPTARTRFTTQIVDLDRHRVLDVIEGPSRAVLGDWLTERGPTGAARSAFATLDPAAGYRAALDEHLPAGSRSPPSGIEGHKTDRLYRARRVLLCGDERLTAERFEWTAGLLEAGDPTARSPLHGSPKSSSETSTPRSTNATPAGD